MGGDVENVGRSRLFESVFGGIGSGEQGDVGQFGGDRPCPQTQRQQCGCQFQFARVGWGAQDGGSQLNNLMSLPAWGGYARIQICDFLKKSQIWGEERSPSNDNRVNLEPEPAEQNQHQSE